MALVALRAAFVCENTISDECHVTENKAVQGEACLCCVSLDSEVSYKNVCIYCRERQIRSAVSITSIKAPWLAKFYMKTVPAIGGNIKLVSPLEAKTHHPMQIGFETQEVHFDDVTVSCSSWTVPELLLVLLSSYVMLASTDT